MYIFYDLETTDKETIGQILNYAFISVDENWKVLSSLTNNIRIERTQIPDPYAILANRTNVIEHQEKHQLSEKDAMKEISDYLWSEIDKAKDKISLIGYNSSKFDLKYLRTSFYRNGLNPYFSGKLVYKDILQVVKKLYLTDPNFPTLSKINDNKEEVLTLALEPLAKEFGLLEGAQVHSSLEDVELSIDFAKYLNENFSLDVRKYQAYEPGNKYKKRDLIKTLLPDYTNFSTSKYIETRYLLLDDNYRYSLWLDLERFKNDKSKNSIKWVNKSTEFLHDGGKALEHEAVNEALNVFSELNLNNFFEKRDCDLEQFIYDLDFDDLDALNLAIWKSNANKIKSKNAKIALLRYKLREYKWGGKSDKKFEEKLKEYAKHRYGGDLKLSSGEEGRKHKTLDQLINEMEKLIETSGAEDKKLIESLLSFAKDSDIYRVLKF